MEHFTDEHHMSNMLLHIAHQKINLIAYNETQHYERL